MEVVLVRHGQTAANLERRFAGALDLPLDAVGLEQAAALARGGQCGPVAAAWTSPLIRAVQTARALHPAPRVVGDLAELHQGVLEGLSLAEAVERHGADVVQWLRDAHRTPIPGGESLAQCRDRAWVALRDISRTAADEGLHRVVVVSHQITIATLLCTACGEPLDAWRQRSLPNCGVARLAVGGGHVRLVEGAG